MAKKKVSIEMDGAKKVIEVPEPLKRKCELKQVLPVSVIQLLASAPHNETVRAVLLAHLKVPVPEELKSYKDIQDWIEFNIEPPKVPASQMKTAPGRSSDLVQIAVIATETENGRCCYSEDLRGTGNIGVTRDCIVQCANDSDSAEEFFNQIKEQMYGDGVRDHIRMDVVEGSKSYSDHDCDDSDGIEVDIKSEGQLAITNALRDLDRERYYQLFG